MLNHLKEELFKEKSFKSVNWKIFKKHIEIVEFEKDEIISKYNHVENYLYFILEGGCRVYYHTPDKDINTLFRFENQFISAYTSFLKRQPSKQTLRAIEKMTAVRISYESSLKLSSYKVGQKIFRKNAEELFILKEQRELSLLLESPDERY
jgi:signal-transduction protein with cAMP-binding, CBS, and nucleotidyltransferase domain